MATYAIDVAIAAPGAADPAALRFLANDGLSIPCCAQHEAYLRCTIVAACFDRVNLDLPIGPYTYKEFFGP